MKNVSNTELFALYREAQAALDVVRREIRSRNIGWQHLASYDMKPEAVMAYRAQYSVPLREAHDAVNAFMKQMSE